MAKQVLGDNPFASTGVAPPAPAAAPPEPAPSVPAASSPARAARTPRAAAKPAPKPPREPRPARRPRRRSVAKPGRPLGRRAEASLLGAEAMPAPPALPEAAPASPASEPSAEPAPAPLERGGLGDEFRMVERWARDRLQPMLAERRVPPFAFVWKLWRKVAMRDRSEAVDEFGRDPVFAQRLEPLLEFLYRSYFRVDTAGLEHVPDAGRAIIVCNHSGTLPYDALMLMHAVRSGHPRHRTVRPLAEDLIFHFPYLGTIVNRIGGVRACPENAERLLGAEQLIAVFPEGVKGSAKLYRERYQLQRFGRGGFIKLALRTDSPIIPAAIVGAEEIHPMVARLTWLASNLGLPFIPITPTFPWLGPLGMIPLPTKWFLRFGPPLYFNAEYGAEAADDSILVNRLAENVRRAVQEMVDGTLAQRRSILFG